MNNKEIEQSAIDRYGKPRKIEEISEEELLSVFPADMLTSFSQKRIIKTYKRSITLHMQGMMRTLDDISDEELIESGNNCFTIEGLQLKCRCLIEDRRRVARRLAKLNIQLETGLGASYEKHSFAEIRNVWETSSSYKEIFTKLDISSYKQAHNLEDRLHLPAFESNEKRNRLSNIPIEVIEHVVSISSSYREVAEKLGLSSSHAIKKYLLKNNIDVEHIEHRYIYMTLNKMHKNTKLSSARIIRMLEYFRGPLCCERCSCTQHNGKPLSLQVHHKNSIHTDNRIENIQILCPNCHNLIEEKGMYEKQSRAPRKALIRENGRKCFHCGISTLEDKPVPLECHHKNGDRGDNSLDNLELLCPNCHSQTPNYTSKGKILKHYSDEEFLSALWTSKTIHEALKKMKISAYAHYYERAKEIISKYNLVITSLSVRCSLTDEQIENVSALLKQGYRQPEIARITGASLYQIQTIKTQYHIESSSNPQVDKVLAEQGTKQTVSTKSYSVCPRCGHAMSSTSRLCVECHKQERKKKPISREELKTLIRKYSFVHIARIYNVTDSTIKKWCRDYHLPSKRSDIVTFSDDEWEELPFFDSDIET